MKFYYVGVDLGQSQDYTAVCLLEKSVEPVYQDHALTKKATYACTFLERYRHIEYPAVVDRVKTLFRNPQLNDGILVVDETGVGRAVCDMMVERGLRPVRISITGGLEVREMEDGFHVPKKNLVTSLIVLFQSESLKIASSLENAAVLVNELENFKVKTNIRTGHETFEAWREHEHDDLVLALALAAWYAETQDKRTGEALAPTKYDQKKYSPLWYGTKWAKR